MSKTQVVFTVLALFVTFPLWFFLLYRILHHVGASELEWFLFWIYVPVTFMAGFLHKVVMEQQKRVSKEGKK